MQHIFPGLFLFKQIIVGAGADQKHFMIGDGINQEPIGLNMAFPTALVFTAKAMRVCSKRQWFIFPK